MKRAQKSTVLDIRRANSSSVLRRIYSGQSMSRQELSQHSGLSSASITNVAAELLEASEGRGGAVKKREEVHRMAEANKAFSHFRF